MRAVLCAEFLSLSLSRSLAVNARAALFDALLRGSINRSFTGFLLYIGVVDGVCSCRSGALFHSHVIPRIRPPFTEKDYRFQFRIYIYYIYIYI